MSRSGVFNVNFEPISSTFWVFSIVDTEEEVVSWVVANFQQLLHSLMRQWAVLYMFMKGNYHGEKTTLTYIKLFKFE